MGIDLLSIGKVCGVKCFNSNCKHCKKFADTLTGIHIKLNECNLKNIEIDEEGQCTNFDEIQQFVVASSSVPVGNTSDNINWSNPLSDSSRCGHDHK